MTTAMRRMLMTMMVALRRRQRSLRWRMAYFGCRCSVAVARSGEVRPSRWRSYSLWLRAIPAGLLAFCLLTWIVFSTYVMAARPTSLSLFGLPVTAMCSDGYGTYCGALTGLLTTLGTLGFAYIVFLFFQFRGVVWRYRRRARTRPQHVVLTAGSMTGSVVGREQLCRVLMNDVSERRGRHPHILIGAVGTGKTAVLVRLTQILADRNFVPVVVRLRDAQSKGKDLDFEAMARGRFSDAIDAEASAGANVDRIWRWLRRDNRIVVLADGLEEVLVQPDGERDRNTAIRQALDRAVDQGLPLIIASRPHDPLRGTAATITELEPLGRGPVLHYLANPDTPDVPERDPCLSLERLTWLMQYAEVTDSPLYMRIIYDLDRVGRLWQAIPEELLPSDTPRDQAVKPPTHRAVLRWHLLEGWREALVDGYLYEDYALDRRCRAGTVEVLCALACIGLEQDMLEVRFDELARPETASAPGEVLTPSVDGAGGKDSKPRQPHEYLRSELVKNLCQNDIRHEELANDLRLAATMGRELGIVDAEGDRIRFRHSVIQAYLGSRYLPVALKNEAYWKAAFSKSGREFLLALVLKAAAETAARSRSATESANSEPAERLAAVAKRTGGARPSSTASAGQQGHYGIALWHRPPRPRRKDLIEVAGRQVSNDVAKALAVFSTALEIDSIQSAEFRPEPKDVLEKVRREWTTINESVQLDRAVIENKHEFIRRFGSVIRSATEDRKRRGGRAGQDDEIDQAYQDFYELVLGDKEHAVRLVAAEEIGKGGDDAYEALSRQLAAALPGMKGEAGASASTVSDRQAVEDAKRQWRMRMMGGWLAPLLYWSSTKDLRRPDVEGHLEVSGAKDYLDRWLDGLARMDPSRRETNPSISMEIGLAHGFKLAANHRLPSSARSGASAADAHRRAVMIETAERALKHSRFWFSQLVLIQALTLWSLPDNPEQAIADRGHGSTPKKQVDYWVEIAGTECRGRNPEAARGPHPFVRAGADLCVLVLKSRRPAQFIWIDEPGTISQIGSYSTESRSQYGQHNWILESVGWTTLHGRAQQLLADVLLMLNLAERGTQMQDVDARLSRADRHDLPPCITTDRRLLNPDQAVGSAELADPGSNCLDECPFRLCPYPPRGQPLHRADFSEGFCGQQSTRLKRRYLRGGPQWTGVGLGQLREFWWRMSQRNRPKNPESAWGATAKGRPNR